LTRQRFAEASRPDVGFSRHEIEVRPLMFDAMFLAILVGAGLIMISAITSLVAFRVARPCSSSSLSSASWPARTGPEASSSATPLRHTSSGAWRLR
jgi:hypothetical protein